MAILKILSSGRELNWLDTRRFHLAFFGTVLFSIAIDINASKLNAETLDDVLVAAYETNPQLRAASVEQKAVVEGVAEARAEGRLHVTASATYQNTDRLLFQPGLSAESSGIGQPTPDISIERRLNYWIGSVEAEQPLFRGGRVRNAIKQARSRVEAGKAVLEETEQQILLRAATAFMDVLRDEAVVELNQNNLILLTRELANSQDRYEMGELGRTDLAQSKARLSGAEAALISAQAALSAARESFRRVVGRSPGSLEAPSPLQNLPATREKALIAALEDSPLIAAAEANEAVSSNAIKVAKGVRLPSVSAIAGYSYSENNSVIGDSAESVVIGARVTIPLFLGGAEYSQIRRAKNENSRDKLLILDAEREVTERTINAWESLMAARAVKAAAFEQIQANEIAYDGVREEYLAGLRTTIERLNAEQELLVARASLIRADRDEFVAGFQLLVAVGRIAELYAVAVSSRSDKFNRN